MRIRSIRPEFWSSEDVAAMDWHTRLVYIGLWSYVDDNGVGRDKVQLITAALFALDDDIPGGLPECSRRVTGALRHLSERGQITRYTVDDKAYLHVSAWTKHQRIEKASAGRYPLPTCDDAKITEPSPTTPGALPEPSPPGEGEKGRRGEVTTSATTVAVDDRFDEFWDAYGYKKDRKPAETKWRAALKKKGVTADLLISAARAYAASCQRTRTFQKHAKTWLHEECWENELTESSNVRQFPGQPVVAPDDNPPPGDPWHDPSKAYRAPSGDWVYPARPKGIFE